MASVAGSRSIMSRKEKFGKFVLLEELETTSVGTQYRAAKLGSAGLEKIVDLLRVSAQVSGHGDTAKTLMDQAKFAAQLQNPNILKIYGIGKVDGSYYISYEFVEGKSLRTVFNRCKSEGFPFSVDHTLLIASKICTAAEYAHSRKVDGGARYYHGYLTPSSVLVSHEGEVRLRGFGYWPARLRDAGGISDEEAVYLAPEQLSGGGDPRSDTFAIGAMLFEALTGTPLLSPDRKEDIRTRIAQARPQGPSGEEEAIPRPIADILNKALALDPGARYAETQEMRKAIDTLLFSGDFTPTTFNLAFFMHSLFREEIERESKVLKEEKDANYFDFLEDDKRSGGVKTDTGPVPLVDAPPPAWQPPSSPAPEPTPAPAPPSLSSLPLIPPPPKDQPIRTSTLTPVPVTATPTPFPSSHREREAPDREPAGVPPREAAAGFTFHKGESKSKMPLFAGLGVVLLIGAGTAAYFLRTQAPAVPPPTAATPSPAPTLSPEQIASETRVRELEEQLQKLKTDQDEASRKAVDAARKRKEEELRTAGKAVDPAAIARAEDEARKKSEDESRKKAEVEQKRLEDARAVEQRRIEEEERRRAEEAARAAAAASTAPVAAATAPPSTRTVQEGDLVAATDPGVVPPKVEKEPALVFPRAAYQAKVGGNVVVNALIDHKGNVVETQVLERVEHPLGKLLEEAAVEHVRGRKYRPATVNGVKVKVWVRVRVPFPQPR